MSEYDELKIETFEGINKNPREPTATLAGNGSYLIAKFNQLVNKLQTEIAALKERVSELENPVNDGTDEAYNWTFFADPPEGRSFVVDSPISGTITKYFIDNVDTSIDIYPTIGDISLFSEDRTVVGSGVEYLLTEPVTLNHGDEIGITYSEITEEIDSTLTLYVR
jgi:hypothetical protein